MDLRVLAAVFLTLFAVAIAMAQGNVDVTDVRESLQDLRTGVDLSSALTQGGNGSTGANLTGSISSPETVMLDIADPARLRFTAGNTTRAAVGGSTLQPSDGTTITAGGFTGEITIAPDNVSIQGTVTRIATPQLAFDYDQSAEFSTRLTRPLLTLAGLDGQSIQLGNATGTVTADATEIQVDREQAVFQEFTGNLSVDGTRYTLTGTVERAALGDAAIR
ncbi:MAG: hypothetical protein SVW77_01710 [Candidatus Nanohaloarchaea archaeon]|nr:hypothetical protein [Candidatus Nanohaloarchaea archaeon]